MTTAKKPRKRRAALPDCVCGHSAADHRGGIDVCFNEDCASCEEYREPMATPKPRKRRETPEQKARRVGKGLGFWLMRDEAGVWWHCFRRKYSSAVERKWRIATKQEIALWRALARARRVRLG